MTINFFWILKCCFYFLHILHLLYSTFSHLLYFIFSHLLYSTFSHLWILHFHIFCILHFYIFTSVHFHIFCIFELLYSSFFPSEFPSQQKSRIDTNGIFTMQIIQSKYNPIFLKDLTGIDILQFWLTIFNCWYFFYVLPSILFSSLLQCNVQTLWSHVFVQMQ